MTNDKSFFPPDDSLCGSVVWINSTPLRISETISQGIDSRIFNASLLQGGRDSAFVIKCYRCRRDGEVWKKAMREIEAGNMLRKCPHIVPLRGYSVLSEGNGEYWCVFLLFDRLQCLEEQTTDPRTALEICRDIALALVGMKKKGLLHGDVKPSNLYTDGEKWLLGDLGSVCLSGQSPDYGSRGYCSPEAMRGEACDIRSDLYSLGVTLYRILSGGRLPFCRLPCGELSREEIESAIERRLKGERIPPIPGVCEEVNRLLLGLTGFDRRERFRNPAFAARHAAELLNKSYSTEDN